MRRSITVAALALLFTVSLALRLWFGLGLVEQKRFWDEQFTVHNVAKVLREHTLEPENGYYSMVSYLPQTAILAGVHRLHAVNPERGFEVLRRGRKNGAWGLSLDAFRLLRGWQAVIAALVCIPTFFLGKRLAGEVSGWVAAAVVAFAPQHIRPAAWAKPDALWSLAFAVALVLAVRAVTKPGFGRFVLAGVSLGFAASAKVPSVFLAPSIGLAILLIEATWRRRLSWLSVTALGSATTFVVLNPYLGMTVDYLGRLSRQYTNRAANRGIDRWRGLEKATVDFPVEVIGAVGLLAAVVGFVWLSVVAWSERSRAKEFPARVLLLSVPVFYYALYFALTPMYKANSLLPLIPLLPLLALFPVERWLKTAPQVPSSWRRILVTGIAGIAITLAFARGGTYVYQSMIPTTELAANRWLGFRLKQSRRPAPRLLVFGELSDSGYRFKGHRSRPSPLVARPSLGEVFVDDPAVLEFADAVVLPNSSELVTTLVESSDTEPFRTTRSVEPSLFKIRGDPLTIVYYHWAAVASTVLEVTESESVDAVGWLLPEMAESDLTTVALNLAGCGKVGPPSLTVGDRQVGLYRTRAGKRGQLMMISARFDSKAGDRIELDLDKPCRVRRAKLFVWRRGFTNVAAESRTK